MSANQTFPSVWALLKALFFLLPFICLPYDVYLSPNRGSGPISSVIWTTLVILVTVFELSRSESPTSRDRAWSASSDRPQRAHIPLPAFLSQSTQCVDSLPVFLAVVFPPLVFCLFYGLSVSLSGGLAHLHLRLVSLCVRI